jgi:transcriptional regulator with XRE-family HTH domain
MFWDNFKKVCDDMGLKPTPVLKATGISTGSIGRWQNGSYPNADAVIAIADYLKVSTDLLLRGEEFCQTSSGFVSTEEMDMLRQFRSLSDDMKLTVQMTIKSMSAVEEKDEPQSAALSS